MSLTLSAGRIHALLKNCNDPALYVTTLECDLTIGPQPTAKVEGFTVMTYDPDELVAPIQPKVMITVP